MGEWFGVCWFKNDTSQYQNVRLRYVIWYWMPCVMDLEYWPSQMIWQMRYTYQFMDAQQRAVFQLFSAFFHQLWTDADWELFDAINVNVFSLIIQIQVHVFRDKIIIVKSINLLYILISCLVSRLYCTCMWNHLGDTILIHIVSNPGLFLIYFVDQRGFLKI